MHKTTSELSEIVDPSYLQAMLKIFTKVMASKRIKVAAAILDDGAKPIIYEENFCGYCDKIRETTAGEEQCTLSDKKAIEAVKEHIKISKKPEALFHICNLGLLDFCAPIIITEKNEFKIKDEPEVINCIGYFFGGQLKVSNFDYANNILTTPNSATIDNLFKKFSPLKTKYKSADEYRNSLCAEYDSAPMLQTKDHEIFKETVDDMVKLLNSFVAELYESHHVKKFDTFMEEVKEARTMDDLLEIVVNKLPGIMDSVNCSIFTVQKGYPEKEDCLVLRKTNYKSINRNIKPNKILEENSSYYKRSEGKKQLTSWVWVKKEPLLLKDINDADELRRHGIERTEGKYNDSDEHKGFLAVPIIRSDGEAIGVIRMPHKKRSKGIGREIGFTNHDAIFLEFLAHHLAPVMERKELLGQLDRTNGLINAAQELARVSSEVVLTSIMQHAISLLSRGKGNKRYFLNLHTPNSKYWIVAKTEGYLGLNGEWENEEFPIEKGLTGRLISDSENAHWYRKAKTQSILFHDIKIAKDKYGYEEAVPNGKSVMAATLENKGKIYGAIAVVSSEKYSFSDKDLEILETLAKISADAIVRTELRTEKAIENKKSDSHKVTIIAKNSSIGPFVGGNAKDSTISMEQKGKDNGVNHTSDWIEIILTSLAKLLKRILGHQ